MKIKDIALREKNHIGKNERNSAGAKRTSKTTKEKLLNPLTFQLPFHPKQVFAEILYSTSEIKPSSISQYFLQCRFLQD
jgi:hypothetical protein